MKNRKEGKGEGEKKRGRADRRNGGGGGEGGREGGKEGRREEGRGREGGEAWMRMVSYISSVRNIWIPPGLNLINVRISNSSKH